jgi:hypothetical protein
MSQKHTGQNIAWPDKKIRTLISLHKEGVTIEQIAVFLKKKPGAVKSAIAKIRKDGVYSLPKRDFVNKTKPFDAPLTSFDIEYRGAVARGHWLICKPWGRVNA